MEINSIGDSATPNSCDTVVGGGNECIFVENVNQLVEYIPCAIVDNTTTIHHMPYIMESKIPLDEINITLRSDNVLTLENSLLLKSIFENDFKQPIC